MNVTNAKISRKTVPCCLSPVSSFYVIAGNPCGKHVLGNRLIERKSSPTNTKYSFFHCIFSTIFF